MGKARLTHPADISLLRICFSMQLEGAVVASQQCRKSVNIDTEVAGCTMMSPRRALIGTFQRPLCVPRPASVPGAMPDACASTLYHQTSTRSVVYCEAGL